MNPSGWTADELNRIGTAEELQIAARRRDSTLQRAVPIWVAHISAGGVDRDVSLAEVGDEVNDAVDAAYRAKYGRHSGYVEPMVAPPARATTLRLTLRP